MAAAVVAVPMIILVIIGDLLWINFLAIPVAFIGGAVVSVAIMSRAGVDLDEAGIHPLLPGSLRRLHVPWHLITDIRAERRGTKTVPVVYIASQKVWRLRVPYDSSLLGGDPQFDKKICTMRNMWETYHSWRRDLSGIRSCS